MTAMEIWANVAGQMMMAQSGGNENIVGIVVLVVVILGVLALAISSRKGAGEGQGEDKPKVQASDVDKPNLDVLSTRKDASEFEGKDESEMSLAEIKQKRHARNNTRRKSRRKTAVEATAESKEEHENIEDSPKDDEKSAKDVSSSDDKKEAKKPSKSSSSDDKKEDEAKEAETSVEEDSFGSFDDDSWGDAASFVDGLDDEAFSDPEEESAVSEAEVSEPKETPAVAEEEPEPVRAQEPETLQEPSEPAATSYAAGLQKTRERGFGRSLKRLFQRETIDDDLKDELEEFLFTSDIGPKAAQRIMQAVETALDGGDKKDPAQVWNFARGYVLDMLKAKERPLDVDSKKPFVILVIGVNGAGKTTTIGKMASQYKKAGKSVMLVAGDTFRAAAVEQLEVWADRVSIPIHKGKSEADPASVVYEGIEKGIEEDFDVIICDTSGRLHTKVNLMDELKKIGKVSGKALEGAPHETILVLDANTGQNAVQQAKAFGAALEITGLVLTKLDGTARGGVILGIGEEIDVPVRFVGIGEGVNDLRQFDAEEFTEALFM